MPNPLGKNLHLCFTKLKSPLSPPLTPDRNHHHPSSSSSSPSSSTASASTSSSVLIKTFNSLYDNTPESLSRTTTTTITTTSDFSTDSDTETPAPPDFATVFASQRFFFSSPGRSNSIIDDSPPESDTLVAGGIPTSTYSPDPYADFRRSMQEMVDSRHLFDITRDWDFLHELLLCYLALNPKYAHKFIIGAFADLLVSLTSSSSDEDHRKSDMSDRCKSKE